MRICCSAAEASGPSGGARCVAPLAAGFVEFVIAPAVPAVRKNRMKSKTCRYADAATGSACRCYSALLRSLPVC